MSGALTHFGLQHIPEEGGKKDRRADESLTQTLGFCHEMYPLPRMPFRASPCEVAEHRDFSSMSTTH